MHSPLLHVLVVLQPYAFGPGGDHLLQACGLGALRLHGGHHLLVYPGYAEEQGWAHLLQGIQQRTLE